jgi:SNF2 family DNA or RNA helicase
VAELRGYQRTAVAYLHDRGRAGLFLDMGLGKTATVLSALTPEHLPALVLAPKRVAEEVWPVEAAKWRPDLTVALAAGSKAKRHRVLRDGADVTVLGVDNLGDLAELDLLDAYETVVIDESSKFKSHRSARFKAVRELRSCALWLLTGTPAPNGLLDLWSQVYLLDGGARLGKNISAYRARYFQVGTFRGGRPAILPNGTVAKWDPKPGAPEAIQRALEDLCLYMSSEGLVDVPEVTENLIAVPLPAAARRAYQTLRKDMVLQLDILDGVTYSAPTAAQLSSKLSQLVAGFLYHQDDRGNPLPSWSPVHSERVNAVVEVVEGTGSPVLVFYRFRAELERLREALPTARHIDEPGVVAEWNAGTVPVLLAHPSSAGHGLNLQHGGHTAVWTSLPWSLDEWSQGNARLARPGQQHPVVIHTLVSPGTIDRAILDALAGKASVQEALLNHLESLL